VKIVDKCTFRNGVQPAPENRHVIGLTFDKASPYHYKRNCDTYKDSLTSQEIVDGVELSSTIVHFKCQVSYPNDNCHCCMLKTLIVNCNTFQDELHNVDTDA